MSREIKFRSWNANEKKMITPCMWVNDCNLVSSQMCSAPTHALMQFTGLKDIDGVEVYEGDFLELKPYQPMEVKFGDGSFFVTPNPHWDVKLSDNYLAKTGLVVIGNVYQNPELLK